MSAPAPQDQNIPVAVPPAVPVPATVPAPVPVPVTLPPLEPRQFQVFIVGGGIAGLTLAILLHKANIPFLVFERAKLIKPLGEHRR